MQDGHQWIAEHFFLTECQQKQIFPALSRDDQNNLLLFQQNIFPDAKDIPAEEPDGGYGKYNKNDLLDLCMNRFATSSYMQICRIYDFLYLGAWRRIIY